MYIFVSSIGRSGTKFLSELFGKLTDLPSYHSIEPHCLGTNLTKKNNGEKDIPEFNKKINKIKKLSSDKNGIFESSHIFLRGYADLVVAANLKPVYVIHMTRDPLEVARSYLNRDSVPGMDNRPWRLPLKTKNSLLREIPTKELNPFQKNICDWIENELKYQQMKHQFDKTFDFYHSDLNNAEKYSEMFQHFGIKLDTIKIAEILKEKGLDKNKNPKKTTVESKDIKDADELIQKIVKTGVKIDIFRDPYYQKYTFIQKIIKVFDDKLSNIQPT